jgi:hypothetical protein
VTREQQEEPPAAVLGTSNVAVRSATADDAQAIGAVFDAAVRAGWKYLGELAEKPLLALQDWDRLVADHAPPNVLLVATDQATAPYRADGSARESDFRGTAIRALRLTKQL